MTLAFRLFRGHAGAAYVVPLPFAITTDGFWNNATEPRAAYYNGRTFFAFINDAGDIRAASYTHAGGAVSTPFAVGSGFTSASGAIHNSIAVLVRSSDRRILIVELGEGMSQPFARVTTNPEDVTAWASPYNILPAGNYTYCALVQLTGGTIYLFTRSIVTGTYYLAFSTSTDGGATWSGMTNLLSPVVDVGMYWRIGCDGDRIHIFATDNLRTDGNPSSVYHCFLDAGVLCESDGTPIAGAFPRPVTDATLVQDDTLGPAWAEGCAIDGSGNPAAVLLVYDAAGTKNLVRAARWTGSAWQVTAVTDSVGIIGGNRFIAGAAIDRSDPDIIYASRNVGGTFELFRYQSGDGGLTWSGMAVSSGSADDNAMPDTPQDAAAGLRVVWGLGTYTSDADFDFDVRGSAG